MPPAGAPLTPAVGLCPPTPEPHARSRAGWSGLQQFITCKTSPGSAPSYLGSFLIAGTCPSGGTGEGGQSHVRGGICPAWPRCPPRCHSCGWQPLAPDPRAQITASGADGGDSSGRWGPFLQPHPHPSHPPPGTLHPSVSPFSFSARREGTGPAADAFPDGQGGCSSPGGAVPKHFPAHVSPSAAAEHLGVRGSVCAPPARPSLHAP